MELHRRRQGLIADRRSCTNLATTTEIDYSAFDALTFDCYGTLIDWETGILAGLWAALAAHRVDGTGYELLGAYADAEATLENGPYFPYREILVGGLRAIAASLGTTVADGEAAAFGGSVADWPAFRHPASAGSLAVGSWLRRGPGPTPVAQGIQLKEPPEETGSADILGANIAQLKALFSTDGLGITPGNPPVWAQGVVAGFDVR